MFDTEKFIMEVEKRPGLYDLKSKDYCNRDMKAKLWDEIGSEMHENWNDMPANERNTMGKELQRKWKSIRDQFKRELNLERKVKSGEPAKKKKKYVFHDQLLFLRNFLESRATCSNIEGDEIVEEGELVECDALEYTQPECPETRKSEDASHSSRKVKNQDFDINIAKEISGILSRSVALQMKDREEDIMGNKAFLMSLLPLMNQLTGDQSHYVRFKLMELLQQLRASNYQPFYNSQPSNNQPAYNIQSYMQPMQSSSSQSLHTIQPLSRRYYTIPPSAMSPVDDPRTSTHLILNYI